MDDIILIVFVSFTLMLMLIGFFKKQNLLTIFSGIGFILIGIFMLQGVNYITGSTITEIDSLTTTQVFATAAWHSEYAVPIFIFLSLFGLMLIIISALDYRKAGANVHDRNDGGGDDE